MLVLNLKVNPKKCVSESSSSDAGIYGSPTKNESPKKFAARQTIKPTTTKKEVQSTAEEIIFVPPVFEPVQVTTLTDEQKKHVKMYDKMHKKEIDASKYKVKTFLAQTKEQAKEKPAPIKRAQVYQQPVPVEEQVKEVIVPEIIEPEIIKPVVVEPEVIVKEVVEPVVEVIKENIPVDDEIFEVEIPDDEPKKEKEPELPETIVTDEVMDIETPTKVEEVVEKKESAIKRFFRNIFKRKRKTNE